MSLVPPRSCAVWRVRRLVGQIACHREYVGISQIAGAHQIPCAAELLLQILAIRIIHAVKKHGARIEKCSDTTV